MGMFDFVMYEGNEYQTKDFDCELTTYFVVPGKSLANYTENVYFHGFLSFYGFVGENWFEYTSKFTDGICNYVNLVAHS